MIRSFPVAAGFAAALLLAACSGRSDETMPAKADASAARAGDEATHDNDAKFSEETGHHDENDHAEGEVGHEEGAPAPIVMDAAALQAAGITIATLEASPLGERLRAPGEVVDNAYGTTLITARVDALVERRHARLGDEVEAGAALVTLSSLEVAQAQGALRIAEQEWERVRALGRDAVSGRRYTRAQVAVDQARATAQAYGVTGGKANGEFTLRAPHAGRITEDAFVVGERIEAGRPLFRLVDETVVWVDAKVAADVARRLRVDGTAQVVLGDVRLAGHVVQSAHRTSEDTRNARVRLEVANPGDRLHGGDYVEVYLDAHGATAQPVLSVPTAALLQLDGETVLFRQAADGALAPVAVRTGEVVGDRTRVLEGVAAGERIVTTGAYALKARLLKSQLGEGHAH